MFQMGKYEYVEAMYVQRVLMTLTGLWPKRNYGCWYKLYGFAMSFVLQAVFMMPTLALVFSTSTDVAQGSYILFCTLTVFTYGIKVIILYLKRNSFHEILNDLEQPLFNNYNNDSYVYMRSAILVSNRTRKLIQVPCIIFFALMAAFPILVGRSERPLPFDLPININSLPFPLYVTVYVMQVLAAAVAGGNTVNIDTLACSFMALGTAQLQMLGANLKSSAVTAASGQEAKKSGRMEKNLEKYGRCYMEVLKNLRECVKHHVAIAKYVEKLEGMFTYMFLAQFLSSVVIISLVGFSIVVIPVTNVLFGAFVSAFGAVMFEISIFCLFGDELMIQSLKIQDACYMSEWDNCDPEIRKTLLIIMERSKRPLVLTAGKFTQLSRISLVTLCKSSFSYFAVLYKLYSGEQQ